MKVIFIHHSCFAAEVDGRVLIFDWFAGDRVQGYVFGGVLPEYAPDTPVYVFASHKHRDHFDMDVLQLAERYSDIHFIFSRDCKMSPNFLKKHGYAPELAEKITYVRPGGKYTVGELLIEALLSTDAGAAFYVQVNGVGLFHAGDLNNWRWEGAGDLVNGMMEVNYKAQIKRLAQKKLQAAFVPMDPRLGQYQFLGMDYFLTHTTAEYVFPMHMWQDYSGIAAYKKQISNVAMTDRIMDITHENQEFMIMSLTMGK